MTKQEWILMTAMRQSFDDTAHIEDVADLLEQKGYFTPSLSSGAAAEKRESCDPDFLV